MQARSWPRRMDHSGQCNSLRELPRELVKALLRSLVEYLTLDLD
jgi:hypothetical protein